MNNTLTTSLLTLIIGLLGGYYAGTQAAPAPMHEMDMHGAMDSMTMGLEGKTGDELDHAFLDEMITHHEGAVEMTQMLLKGTTRPELKQLGTAIVEAQTKEIEMMKKWQNEWFAH